MQRKFKEGSYRLVIWLTALPLLALALASRPLSMQLILAAGATLLVAITHLRPSGIRLGDAWLPALMACVLTLTLTFDPQHYMMWLWAWAAVLALPQPTLLFALNAALSALAWVHIQRFMPPEQGLLAGLLMAILGLLALARSLGMQARWRNGYRYSEHISDTRLESQRQLHHDLLEEIARCQREKTHGVLVLLHSRHTRLITLTRLLTAHTRGYETCYQLDRHSLATLLIDRDATAGKARRDTLIAALPENSQARFIGLLPGLDLTGQLRALTHQQRALIILEEYA